MIPTAFHSPEFFCGPNTVDHSCPPSIHPWAPQACLILFKTHVLSPTQNPLLQVWDGVAEQYPSPCRTVIKFYLQKYIPNLSFSKLLLLHSPSHHYLSHAGCHGFQPTHCTSINSSSLVCLPLNSDYSGDPLKVQIRSCCHPLLVQRKLYCL